MTLNVFGGTFVMLKDKLFSVYHSKTLSMVYCMVTCIRSNEELL